jgi:arylsulfatase
MADDLGWTDIGSYGGEIDTPHLDALAQQGILFTDFHVSVSCSPTRSMLLSGNDNHVAGLGNMGELLTENQIGQPGYEGHLNDRVATLAEVLRDGGYHTYMAGKWHLGHEKGSLPYDRGFERSFSMLVGGASHWADRLGIHPGDNPAAYSLNGEHIEELPADHYSSMSFADFLMDSIRENRGDSKPFLAYLAFQAVHDPVHVPEPWLSKYRGRYDALLIFSRILASTTIRLSFSCQIMVQIPGTRIPIQVQIALSFAHNSIIASRISGSLDRTTLMASGLRVAQVAHSVNSK